MIMSEMFSGCYGANLIASNVLNGPARQMQYHKGNAQYICDVCNSKPRQMLLS